MFKVNDDKSIYMTRGDGITITLAIATEEGNYTFRASDVVRLNVFEKKACNCVVFSKDFYPAEGADSVDIELDREDAKIGELINKPKDYWYEVELNPLSDKPQTIVGYDEDGPKVFRLFPEGGDLT